MLYHSTDCEFCPVKNEKFSLTPRCLSEQFDSVPNPGDTFFLSEQRGKFRCPAGGHCLSGKRNAKRPEDHGILHTLLLRISGKSGIQRVYRLCCAVEFFFHFPEIDNLQLYIPHLDAGTEVVQLPVIDNQFRAALDIRGVGESQSACYDQYIGSRAFTAPYSTEYHIDSCGLLFGESLLGRRTFDVLSAIAFAKASGTKNIALCGRGMGSLPALLAALLSDEVNSLTLYDAPRSWMSMIQKTVTAWPQSAMPFGILKIADLPEIRDAVESVKPLETVSFAEEPMPETQTLN